MSSHLLTHFSSSARRALAVALGGLALGPAGALAAEGPAVTSQARGARAEALAYAPAPPSPGAVCLVDSGVDLVPDTSANVIARVALDGGTPGDVLAGKHGTLMAMVGGAPRNGWGMVGAWQHLRVASVRALPEGQDGFPFDNYRRGIYACRELRQAGQPITAINLSLGGVQSPPVSELERLRDSVRFARSDGINVVAGAGNANGPVNYPAAVPEVLAAGGSDENGTFCSFSARGSGLDLIAPGCGLDGAFVTGEPTTGAAGTSQASAFTSAVLVALRSYRPGLSVEESEQLVLAHTDRGGNLNVEATFQAAGLGGVMAAGRANIPQPLRPNGGGEPDDGDGDEGGDGGSSGPQAEPAPPEAGSTASPLGARALPRPRLRVSYRAGRLVVRVLNRPAGARARVSIYRGGREFAPRRIRTWTLRGSTLRARARSFDRVGVQFSAAGAVSSSTIVRR